MTAAVTIPPTIANAKMKRMESSMHLRTAPGPQITSRYPYLAPVGNGRSHADGKCRRDGMGPVGIAGYSYSPDAKQWHGSGCPIPMMRHVDINRGDTRADRCRVERKPRSI